MSEETKEDKSIAIHKKMLEKGKEFIVKFFKHPFNTAGDIVVYMVGFSVGVWVILSVAQLCWNMLHPFFSLQW
jgi:hypothetical protein